MLKIKYNPGGMALNGPAFEGFATRVVLDGQEILVVAATPSLSNAIAAYLSDGASQPAHILIGQPPWYMNETKEHSLEDMLPPVAPAAPTRTPLKQDQPRQRGFFDDE